MSERARGVLWCTLALALTLTASVARADGSASVVCHTFGKTTTCDTIGGGPSATVTEYGNGDSAGGAGDGAWIHTDDDNGDSENIWFDHGVFGGREDGSDDSEDAEDY